MNQYLVDRKGWRAATLWISGMMDTTRFRRGEYGLARPPHPETRSRWRMRGQCGGGLLPAVNQPSASPSPLFGTPSPGLFGFFDGAELCGGSVEAGAEDAAGADVAEGAGLDGTSSSPHEAAVRGTSPPRTATPDLARTTL